MSIQLGDGGFSPRVLLVRKNSILEVKHVGDVRHNANLHFLREPLRSLVVPKREEPIVLEHSTSLPVPVTCDSHPHEMAWILVHDHPLAGISDEEGLIVIRDLPVGEVWFRLWHELLITGVAKPTINGQPAKTEGGRIAFEIKAGENPVVDLEFPSESFRLP